MVNFSHIMENFSSAVNGLIRKIIFHSMSDICKYELSVCIICNDDIASCDKEQ